MANSKTHGVADETAHVTANGDHKGYDRAADTARKVAGSAQQSTQHVVDEWTRGVKEGLTRYQECSRSCPVLARTVPRSARPDRSLASS